MPKVIALVPSVPKRADNLLAILEALRDQTLRPSSIVVFLNGYPFVPRALQSLATIIEWSSEPRGPGIRWAYADILGREKRQKESIVVSLDDDFMIEPTYIEQSVEALIRTGAAMVSWTGHHTPRRYLDLAPIEKDVSLWAAGTGTATLWMRHVAGMTNHHWANECLGIAGDEEALLSLWLWQHQLQMVRPAGAPALHHIDALQYADDASHLVHGPTWAARRQVMIEQYGWRA
jgi:hypothetical protein